MHRERYGSKPGIKILLSFLKNITGESDLEIFQDLILALDACYRLHKVISKSLSRFGDDRGYDFRPGWLSKVYSPQVKFPKCTEC